MSKSKLIAESLGVDKAFHYEGRLVRTVRNIEGINQVAMGVIGLSEEDQEYLGGQWERMDCEIIIIPKKKYSPSNLVKNLRIDQCMQMLNKDEEWEEKENE